MRQQVNASGCSCLYLEYRIPDVKNPASTIIEALKAEYLSRVCDAICGCRAAAVLVTPYLDVNAVETYLRDLIDYYARHYGTIVPEASPARQLYCVDVEILSELLVSTPRVKLITTRDMMEKDEIKTAITKVKREALQRNIDFTIEWVKGFHSKYYSLILEGITAPFYARITVTGSANLVSESRGDRVEVEVLSLIDGDVSNAIRSLRLSQAAKLTGAPPIIRSTNCNEVVSRLSARIYDEAANVYVPLGLRVYRRGSSASSRKKRATKGQGRT